MLFHQPFSQIGEKRYSCRSYAPELTSGAAFASLDGYISNLPLGPFKTANRFQLVLANGEDRSAIKGLGTYGAIKNSPGFIIGAARPSEMDMEDFGYRMELIVLKATELDLGTCWLGGTFTRSSFSRKVGIVKGETLPAVCSVGYPATRKTIEQVEQSRKRFDWGSLFFNEDFNTPLDRGLAGNYANPLEMVRLAPSAKNYQPWRIVKQGIKWHFFLQRYKGYREFVVPIITGIADLQRIDMGIAMAHFAIACRESGFLGSWEINDPGIALANDLMEYSFTWFPNGKK